MKEEYEKALEIIKDYKSRSNKELIFAMDKINEDFEFTKKQLIDLSIHLDRLEESYNLILKEYKTRTNG
jgi:hypothetical protein